MKKYILSFFAFFIFGCANFDPRIDGKIDNQQGKIDEIRNNQNGLMLELGKLKNDATISNSQLKELQQGLINLNAALSRNENSGIQILQGDGALMLIFGLVVIGMILYFENEKLKKSEKIIEILAYEIVKFNDPYLNDNVLNSARNSKSEKYVYNLLAKIGSKIK